jgi:hypothetical protein
MSIYKGGLMKYFVDKVMLAHAWLMNNIEIVSILVFTGAASWPA